MKRTTLFLAATLAFFPAVGAPQAPKDAAERAEALRLADAWLDSVQTYNGIPAISAGVVVGDDAMPDSPGGANRRERQSLALQS